MKLERNEQVRSNNIKKIMQAKIFQFSLKNFFLEKLYSTKGALHEEGVSIDGGGRGGGVQGQS